MKIRCDSTESNPIEKDRIGVRPGVVWGKGEEGWCDVVCKVRLDDWINRGSDHLSFTWPDDLSVFSMALVLRVFKDKIILHL